MRVLVGCEESQVICKAFRARGHDAFSCDIIDCSGGHPEWHIKDDVLNHLNDGWDLGIFNPPCTNLCNSGIRWLHTDDTRWYKMVLAADFFKELLNAPIPRICVENSKMHIYAYAEIGRKEDQSIQPYSFGDCLESKETCLWLKNLPKLRLTGEFRPVDNGIKQSVFKQPPSPDRGRIRSVTFQEIADAMAEQWG